MFTAIALFTSSVLAQPGCGDIGSYLYQPSYSIDRCLRGPAVPYMPKPGDIILVTDRSIFWKVTHIMGLAGEPHGSAIVICRPDGTLGTLEAGPNTTFFVDILDTLPHLQEYADKGEVWIRRRKCPLTPEESARLTEFALQVKDHRFALARLGRQLTPFRTRGPLRTYFMGYPHGVRRSYFCSECVTEAMVAAGLLDRCTTRPSATYPHELFTDTSMNLYLKHHFSLADCYDPPARWTSCPKDVIAEPCAPAVTKDAEKPTTGWIEFRSR
jgi:hypothetical protein